MNYWTGHRTHLNIWIYQQSTHLETHPQCIGVISIGSVWRAGSNMAADRRELKKKGKPRREAAAADTCQPFAIAVSEDCDGTTTSKNSSNTAINSCHHDPFCPPCYLLLHTLQPHPDIPKLFCKILQLKHSWKCEHNNIHIIFNLYKLSRWGSHFARSELCKCDHLFDNGCVSCCYAKKDRRTQGVGAWARSNQDYPSLVKIGTLLCRHSDSGGWFLQWENQFPRC